MQRITVADSSAGPLPPAALHFDPAEGEQRDARLDPRGPFPAPRAAARGGGGAGIEHRAPARSLGGAPDAERGGGGRCRASTLRAPLVLACDGRRSATARAAGIRYLAWDYPQTGLVCAVEHDRPHGGEAHQAFFPAGRSRSCRCLATARRSSGPSGWRAAEEVAAMDDAAYTAELAQRLGGRLGEIRLAGRRWVYPLGLSLATHYAAPRLAVAGDAAHGVHPIAGQGMNMGLRDVAALAEVLVEAARRGEDIGALDVLRRYERWRRFDATAMALGMDGLNRLFSTAAGPVQALRNIGLHMVARLAPARRFFMAEAAGLSGEVPRLLAGQAI